MSFIPYLHGWRLAREIALHLIAILAAWVSIWYYGANSQYVVWWAWVGVTAVTLSQIGCIWMIWLNRVVQLPKVESSVKPTENKP